MTLQIFHSVQLYQMRDCMLMCDLVQLYPEVYCSLAC